MWTSFFATGQDTVDPPVPEIEIGRRVRVIDPGRCEHGGEGVVRNYVEEIVPGMVLLRYAVQFDGLWGWDEFDAVELEAL
jgi:hypothetical protein